MDKLEIPSETAALFSKLAKEENTDKATLMRKALSEYLEDYLDARAAEEAYAEWVADGRKSYSLEEIKQELNIE